MYKLVAVTATQPSHSTAITKRITATVNASANWSNNYRTQVKVTWIYKAPDLDSSQRRSCMDHTTPCLPLPRKCSPDGATMNSINYTMSIWKTSNCSLLLTYQPRKHERLSWPGRRTVYPREC